MANKIQYGLEKVHYAVATESGGVLTYSEPVAWPGAVSIALEAQGDTTDFFADNSKFFTAIKNNGYSGDFESALIPDSFRTDVMGDLEMGGLIVEDANAAPKAFALMFQFKGDVSDTRYVLYNCKMSRPSIESATTEDGVEVKTVTGEITAAPRLSDGYVKAYCGDPEDEQYEDWYDAVQEPIESA